MKGSNNMVDKIEVRYSGSKTFLLPPHIKDVDAMAGKLINMYPHLNLKITKVINHGDAIKINNE
tara:strand:- start:211 stop:402 length:192 start_codon:yes stop_codon:yes gene_type:complete